MLKYYYILWVDAVHYIRKKEKSGNDILLPLVIMTMPVSGNIISLMMVLNFIGIKINLIGFGHYLISLLGIQDFSNRLGTIIFLFVICLINYIFVFNNGKINMLMERYPHHNGKIFIRYSLISIFVPLVGFIVYFLYKCY